LFVVRVLRESDRASAGIDAEGGAIATDFQAPGHRALVAGGSGVDQLPRPTVLGDRNGGIARGYPGSAGVDVPPPGSAGSCALHPVCATTRSAVARAASAGHGQTQ